MSKTKKFLYSSGAVLGGVAAMLIPFAAHAQTVIGDIGSLVVGNLAFFFSYILAFVGGIVIGIEAWLVGVVLNINTGIFETPIVQQGFGVSLAVANLGFVLGIIVIALATILHRETYSIKQVLWKLVLMAVLVNFGLVIMAPIVGFGNSLTQYFLTCVDPTSGGCGNGNNVDGLTSMDDFATKLAGSFNPQAGLVTGSNVNSNQLTQNLQSVQGTFSSAGSDLSKWILPIASIFFVAIQLIMEAIVLAVLIFMLLVRYIYIAILAVLLPFAWLSWVFPAFKSNFTKWWSQLVRWTFFAPIVVFFLWLANQTMTAMSNASTGSQSFQMYSSASNPAWASVSNFFTNIFSPITQNFLNMLVMVGLSIGGMIAADKMGIQGAKVAVGAAQSVGRGVTGYVGKKSKQGARWTWQRAGGKDLENKMKESRFPLVSAAGRGITGLTEKGGKGLVKEAATEMKLGDMSDEDMVRAAKGARGSEKTLAVIAEAQKRGKLDMIGEIGGKKDLNTWMKGNQRVFEDYDHGKLKGDVNSALMSSERMRQIAEKQAEARSGVMAEDTYGFLGAAGAQVSAEKLQEKMGGTTRQAEEAAKRGITFINDGRGGNIPVADFLRNSTDVKAALNKAADEVRMPDEADKDGKTLLGGPAGQMEKAGELMQRAAEKFFAGKDRSDIPKFHPEDVFAGAGKFGLSKEALETLGRGIAHGMATTNPGLTPGTIGKLDSAKLRRFADHYIDAINEAVTLTESERIELRKAIKDSMANRLVADVVATTTTPTPTAANPAPTGGGATGGNP